MGKRNRPEQKGYFMSQSLYEATKLTAQIILPAVATLYAALAGIWGLEGTEKVVATITALDLFLGALTRLSSKSYAKSPASADGALVVTTDEEGNKNVSLELHDEAAVLADRQQLIFKVRDGDLPSG